MEREKIPRSFGTHDGTFHADEVTACALLLLFDLIDLDKIVRSRDMAQLERCEYICDVGGEYIPSKKLFDHHQAEYQGPMSSAGMVLLHLKEHNYVSPKEYDHLNNTVIQGVDAHDNGRDPQIPGLSTYSHVISSFTPIDHDADAATLDHTFVQAVQFAKDYLHRVRLRYQYVQSCRLIVSDVMKSNSRCLIFDKNIPWMDSFFDLDGIHHPALFVIMPSGHHWKLRGIPPNYEEKMKVRLPLPLEWGGLLDEELKKVSGIPGAIFCHKGRFISVWETREDALAALDYVLKKGNL